MEKNNPISAKPPLDTGDRRVSLSDEVDIKADLKGRKLNQLIESFHSATSVDERAKLQKRIQQIAKDIHETAKSNEP